MKPPCWRCSRVDYDECVKDYLGFRGVVACAECVAAEPATLPLPPRVTAPEDTSPLVLGGQGHDGDDLSDLVTWRSWVPALLFLVALAALFAVVASMYPEPGSGAHRDGVTRRDHDEKLGPR